MHIRSPRQYVHDGRCTSIRRGDTFTMGDASLIPDGAPLPPPSHPGRIRFARRMHRLYVLSVVPAAGIMGAVDGDSPALEQVPDAGGGGAAAPGAQREG